jgi:hypothetical protein
LPLTLAWISLFALQDTFVALVYSVSRGTTLYELWHSWDAKHNFQMIKPPSKQARRCRDAHCSDDHGAEDETASKKRMKYKHKWVSMCGTVRNLIGFVLGCSVQGRQASQVSTN